MVEQLLSLSPHASLCMQSGIDKSPRENSSIHCLLQRGNVPLGSLFHVQLLSIFHIPMDTNIEGVGLLAQLPC